MIIVPKRSLILPRGSSGGLALPQRQRGFMVINPSRFAAAGGDPYFSSVVAGLHCDGTNGSTTFTDIKGKTWTAGGSAAISTTSPKFGTGALLLNGSTDYISSASHADWAFGTGDFTIGLWARFDAHTTTMSLVSNYTGSTAGISFQWRTDTGLAMLYGDTNLCNSGLATFTPTNGTYYFIEASRNSGVLGLTVDGVLAAKSSSAGTNMTSTAAMYIGRLGALGAQYMAGRLDDVRITKGVGRHDCSGFSVGQAVFTPPIAAFPDS